MPGNPGLRERRPDAIAAVSKARDEQYLDELTASAKSWLPVVQELRPHHSWDNVVRVLARGGQDWTIERLRRASHRMVRAQLADPQIIARSPHRPPSDHLMQVVAAIAIAHPGLSLRAIAAELDLMGDALPEMVASGRRRPSAICSTRHFASASLRANAGTELTCHAGAAASQPEPRSHRAACRKAPVSGEGFRHQAEQVRLPRACRPWGRTELLSTLRPGRDGAWI